VSGLERVYIPSRVGDNSYLGAGYVQQLKASGSKELVQAWLDGDWSVIEGAFFDCWSTARHVVRPFVIPQTWTRFRSADWGAAKPFSVGWWAIVSDEYKAESLTLPRGCLVRYREWYGCETGKQNVGLKLNADQVGDGIVERERGDPKLSYGVLDPAAFSENGGPSIAERINNRLLKSKNTPFHEADNARVPQRGAMGGWDQMRSRLVGDDDGNPMAVCFSTCVDSIRTIPALQHDAARPEDLNSDMEDHAADEWRYGCMSRPWVRKSATDDKPKNLSGYGPARSTATAGDWRAY
jgi:hypothetical protein